MERGGVVASLFLIVIAFIIGYFVGMVFQAGDLNESLSEENFFKNCNLKYSDACDSSHLYLSIFFIFLSIIGIFVVHRNAASIITPIIIYYFSLMAGFFTKFLF